MATIHNPTIRLFHLPPMGDEKPGMLKPGKTLPISDAYLKMLKSTKNSAGKLSGWALRLDVKGKHGVVREPEGGAGAFSQRIKAKRKTVADAAKVANGKGKGDDKARIDALEAEAAAKAGAEGSASAEA